VQAAHAAPRNPLIEHRPVARNRKRAKERRSRRPQPAATPARGNRGAPDPIAHATPDAELAEAQLSVGRPEPSEEEPQDSERAAEDLEPTADSEPDLEPAGRRSPIPGYIPERPGVAETPDGEELTSEELAEVPHAEHPVKRASTVSRLVTFLQGSWRELQRVQWPDRRQVMQATGVVIGFVIVAGAYLGAADAVAGKIVDFILK
jgi:preprotein translocase SecE subunit